MRAPLAPIALALALSRGALAAEPAAEAIRYQSGAEQVPGYLALPQAGGKRPALVVIHEWWGLNDWVKEKARAFAAKGYVALAVDLYRGSVASDPDTAHQLARGLPEDRAARDLEAAFAYLASRPDVDARRIGTVGWCMGGGYALALALEEPKLAAAVIYYGRLATDPEAIQKIRARLLGNFGEEDKGIPPDSVRAFEDQARKAGVEADFKIYPAAGHGFASSRDPGVFRTAAARDADARTDAFFAKALSP
jgi:carboxymethylenebutenolidase